MSNSEVTQPLKKQNKLIGCPYEKDVMNWFAQGFHAKKISRLLKTEKNYTASIYTVKEYKILYLDKQNVMTKVQSEIMKREISDLGIKLANNISDRYISLIEKRKSLAGEIRGRISRIEKMQLEEEEEFKKRHDIWEAKNKEEQESVPSDDIEEQGINKKKDIFASTRYEPRKPDINTAVESVLNGYYHTLHTINKYVEQFTIRHDLSRMLEGVAVEVSKVAIETLLKEVPMEKKEFALIEFRARVTSSLQEFIQKITSSITSDAPSFGGKNGPS